jgi:hypothetical protein
MNDKQKEILVITQEEAAEVIQEISKIFRFGIDGMHRDGMPHRERLVTEIGDLLCMINLMVDHGLIDRDQIEIASQYKITKLKKYSNIYQ